MNPTTVVQTFGEDALVHGHEILESNISIAHTPSTIIINEPVSSSKQNKNSTFVLSTSMPLMFLVNEASSSAVYSSRNVNYSENNKTASSPVYSSSYRGSAVDPVDVGLSSNGLSSMETLMVVVLMVVVSLCVVVPLSQRFNCCSGQKRLRKGHVIVHHHSMMDTDSESN